MNSLCWSDPSLWALEFSAAIFHNEGEEHSSNLPWHPMDLVSFQREPNVVSRGLKYSLTETSVASRNGETTMALTWTVLM